MQNEKRSSGLNKIFIKSEDEIASLNIKKFLEKYNVYSIIRIQKEDFIFLKTKPKILTHFNLQFTNHQKGKKYALLLIIKPGSFDKKKDTPPILSLENIYVAECIETRNNINYDQLNKEDFRYSFPNIKNVEQLKKVIVKRYNQSMKDLSKEKILSLGVGITKLKGIKKIKVNKS